MQDQLHAYLFPEQDIHFLHVLIALPLATAIGNYISWIYRRTHRGFTYNPSFNMTIVMVSVIVTLIMITIGANIALSLGLIGSLSIVRFRTVLKDTTDMSFLFWAIAEGLTVGSHNYVAAALSALVIGAVVTIFSQYVFRRLRGNDYVVIARLAPDQGSEAMRELVGVFDTHGLSWQVRSSELDKTHDTQEIVYQVDELNRNFNANDLIEAIQSVRGVLKASLLTSETNQFV